jgi:dTMP kinase
VVVSDRYADASLAYQGGGRGLGVATVERLNEFATGGILPDLTLLLDLPVRAALGRIRHRREQAGSLDRFDQEGERFHQAVRDTYLALAKRDPDRFRVIASDAAEDLVSGEIWRAVEPVLARIQGAGGFAGR